MITRRNTTKQIKKFEKLKFSIHELFSEQERMNF